jgi:hypothetical protein
MISGFRESSPSGVSSCPAPASIRAGALTQERLGWHPIGPGLISDLDQMRYFET